MTSHDRLARLALAVAGAMLLVVGLRGLFTPRVLLGEVGVPLGSAPALSEIRASFGGKNLGMALFFQIGRAHV